MSKSLGNQILDFTAKVMKEREEKEIATRKKAALDELTNWAIEAGNAGKDFYLNSEKGYLAFQIGAIIYSFEGNEKYLSEHKVEKIFNMLGFEIHRNFERSYLVVSKTCDKELFTNLYDEYRSRFEKFRATEERKADEDAAVIIEKLNKLEELPREEYSVSEEGCIKLYGAPQSSSEYYLQCLNKRLWSHEVCVKVESRCGGCDSWIVIAIKG